MDGAILETLRVVLRWLHLLATTAWVGSSLFYLLALRPVLRSSAAPPSVGSAAGRELGRLARLCIPVLLVSGALLTFDRLADGRGNALYAGLLALKIAAAVVMFALAWELGRRRGARATSDVRATVLVALGVLILLLAPLLRAVYGT